MRGDYQATVDAVQLLVTKRRQLLEVDEVAYGVLLSASTKLEREARAHLTGPPEEEARVGLAAFAPEGGAR